MKTGFYEQARQQTSVITAVFFVFALVLVLSGCEDNSPISVPTSTMPGSEDKTSQTNESNSPQIPEYETDLNLSDEEKEAVEGALVAFEGFFQSINRAYSGELDRAEVFPKYASGEALKSIQAEADSIRENKASFTGRISPLTLDVFDVESTEKGSAPSSVVFHFCVDTTDWAMTQAGASPTTNPDGKVTMEHKVLFNEGQWRVEQQSLWERKC